MAGLVWPTSLGGGVDQRDDALLARLASDERQSELVTALEQQATVPANEQRVDREPQLVEQAVLKERVPELAVTVNDKVPPVLLLELADLRRHVTADDRRVGPVGALETRREHVLRHLVESIRV